MKILIVDDSVSWQNYHKNVIEEIFLEKDFNDFYIDLASSAQEGYNLICQNNKTPYDLIISDLQMEETYEPKYAGVWFIEQVQTFSSYFKTNIIISSGCYNIKQIAESLNVDYIPKRTAVNDINNYKEFLLEHFKI